MAITTTVRAPRRSQRHTPTGTAVAPRPWWVDMLTGHAKAVVGGLGTFCFTLGSAAVNGHIGAAQVLISVGAALGVGGGVHSVANTGPRAPQAA